MAGLGARSIDAVLWGAGGTVLRLLVQIGAQIVLARVLGPEQYGLFAIGAIVIGFSAFFSDVGLAYGLIQKTSVGARDVRFVFTWQLVLGCAVSLAVWAGSDALAGFLGDARAAGAMAALSLVCLLNALAAPSLNLLKRALDFRAIQIAQLASYVLGYVAVGLPLAFAGAQVWALVAAWLVQALVSALLLYRATRHAVSPLFWYEDARAQSRYALTVFGTNLVNWLINNIDRVTVGRSFGSRDIGLYATSYNLLYNPTMAALGVVQPVFFAASSRLAASAQPMAQGYRALAGVLATLALPLFACVAVAAETVVAVLYGPKWAAAAPLLPPLALAMPVLLLWGLTTPLLWAGGKPGREFKVQLPLVLVWGLVCYAASRHSLVAVAWAMLALQCLRTAAMVWAATRVLGISAGALVRSAAGGMALALGVAALVGLVEQVAQPLSPALRLLADAGVAGAAWWFALHLFPQLIAPEAAALLARLLARLPGKLAFLSRNGGQR
jgi:O-antigen/teichoic acid export membrane protein